MPAESRCPRLRAEQGHTFSRSALERLWLAIALARRTRTGHGQRHGSAPLCRSGCCGGDCGAGLTRRRVDLGLRLQDAVHLCDFLAFPCIDDGGGVGRGPMSSCALIGARVPHARHVNDSIDPCGRREGAQVCHGYWRPGGRPGGRRRSRRSPRLVSSRNRDEHRRRSRLRPTLLAPST